MKLYYTVSSGSEAIQTKPQLSLGGYKSSTPLVNSQIGNLFSDITTVTINSFNQNQYVALVLKNDTGAAISNASMWFEYPSGCYSKFRIAAVDMTANTDGDAVMEQIQSINSKPLYGDFYEADSVTNAVDIGDIGIDEQIGLWIERELLLEVIAEQQGTVYEVDPALEGRFKEVVLPKLDEINIGISWS